MAEKNERTKTIKFNLDKQEDVEIWEWLQGLPHGLFSELTKKFWKEKKVASYRILEEQITSGKISMVYGHMESEEEKK